MDIYFDVIKNFNTRNYLTCIKKLELMKSKYQIELMKLTGNTYAQDATMGEEDLSAGGMKK